MKNINKINQNCHPELVSGSMVGSALKVEDNHNGSCQCVNGFRTKSGMTGECGRSMVEMLGVLAIIGVLSVGGIAGYTMAMNKHRANEILNAASVRAVVVSTKLQQNSTADITNALAEFGNETIAGASFTAVSASGNTFTLTLSGVSSEACAQIKNIVGENGNVAINEGCTSFTYNNDLSNGVTTGPAIQEDQTVESCETSDYNSGLYDYSAGFTGDSTDEKVDSSYCYCHKDTPIWDGTGCVATSTKVCNSSKPCDSGEYCSYKNSGLSCNSNNGYPVDAEGSTTEVDGVCEKVAGVKKTEGGQFYYSVKSMDWFSAKNWCEALPGSHTMVQVGILTAAPFNCSSEDYTCDWTPFTSIGLNDYYWTDSCSVTTSGCEDSDRSAWTVGVRDNFYSNTRNSGGFRALCE